MFDINRALMVVKPRQPFLDWLRSVDSTNDDESLATLREDSNAYLIPEYDFDDDRLEILKWCFEDVFAEELLAWYLDESLWPQQRTFEMFREWFDVEFHSLVFDLVDELPLEHTDDDVDAPISSGDPSSNGH